MSSCFVATPKSRSLERLEKPFYGAAESTGFPFTKTLDVRTGHGRASCSIGTSPRIGVGDDCPASSHLEIQDRSAGLLEAGEIGGRFEQLNKGSRVPPEWPACRQVR